jgi:hypothetical protein
MVSQMTKLTDDPSYYEYSVRLTGCSGGLANWRESHC